MTRLDSLEALLVDGMKDVLDAEKKFADALPRMGQAASTPELRAALTTQLTRTLIHVERAIVVLNLLGAGNLWKRCVGIECLIDAVHELINDDHIGPVTDAGLIASAQKILHYQIASYGTARSHAHAIGRGDVARLLDETLSEDSASDRRFTAIADGGINARAAANITHLQ